MERNRIYAKKGSRKTSFTKFVWENMGSDKNGWTVDAEAMAEKPDAYVLTAEKPAKVSGKVAAANASKEVSKEARYQATIEKAKGFEKDGKAAKAFDEYAKAYAIKPTQGVADKMEELEGAIAEAMRKVADAQEAAEAAKKAKASQTTGEAKKGAQKVSNEPTGASDAGAATPNNENDPVIEEADKAFDVEDFVLALELYQAADQENAHVIARIAECEQILMQS